MTEIRKVSPGSGAEWLLGGIALLRKAPVALGLLGLIWGGLSALASMTGQLWLNLVLALLGPILFGGMLYAVREVDQDRPALPGHLLQGMRDGKGGKLVAMLLPQLAALVVAMVLLFAMIGAEQLQVLVKVMEEMQTNPDPQLAEALPAGSLFAWLLAVVVIGVVAGFFTFLAVPDVMFTERGAFAAMALSFRACLRNVAALLVLILVLFIAMFAASLAMQLLVVLLGFAVGAQAAMFVGQLLLMAVVLPVVAGAIYLAWRQVIGAVGPAAASHTLGAGDFEA